MACGSGSTRTRVRRGSAPPRVGAAAWRVTLPALPTGTRASRTTIKAINRTARGLTPGPGSGVLWRATAVCASTLSRGIWPSSLACAPAATPRPRLPTIGRHWRRHELITSGSSGGEHL
eukprot:scaffold17180_cov87-Phaeocystis_antarctica.AAC.1